jgi:SCP-2 sterol transfer family
MSHQFLSDDWLAAVKEVRDKYADEAPPVPYKIRLNQVITDTPFDGDINMFMDTSEGTMVMDKGALESPEVTLTLDYGTAKKLFVDQDQAAVMQAFMGGKIKVQGDMMKLMTMGQAPVDEFSKKVAQEIKDLTA